MIFAIVDKEDVTEIVDLSKNDSHQRVFEFAAMEKNDGSFGSSKALAKAPELIPPTCHNPMFFDSFTTLESPLALEMRGATRPGHTPDKPIFDPLFYSNLMDIILKPWRTQTDKADWFTIDSSLRVAADGDPEGYTVAMDSVVFEKTLGAWVTLNRDGDLDTLGNLKYSSHAGLGLGWDQHAPTLGLQVAIGMRGDRLPDLYGEEGHPINRVGNPYQTVFEIRNHSWEEPYTQEQGEPNHYARVVTPIEYDTRYYIRTTLSLNQDGVEVRAQLYKEDALKAIPDAEVVKQFDPALVDGSGRGGNPFNAFNNTKAGLSAYHEHNPGGSAPTAFFDDFCVQLPPGVPYPDVGPFNFEGP